MHRLNFSFMALLILATTLFGSPTQAEQQRWRVSDVIRIALKDRPEITAARARAEAAQERPKIVSALEDPMLSPSIDHYPFKTMRQDAPMDSPEPAAQPDNGRYNWSLTLEQRFPFSKVLSHRRQAAEADASKAFAEMDRTLLDIELDSISAFFMLQEKRQMATVIAQQLELARQVVSAAGARYSSGSGNQADVLRAEVEAARLLASFSAIQAEIRSAETMLNTSLGRSPGTPVPELITPNHDQPLPSREAVKEAALQQRPELRMGKAEVARAGAEIKTMRAMYAPMGMVRLGYASTMAEGKGAMLMVGVSLPIWREKLHSGENESLAMERMAQADLDAMRRMAVGEAISARDQLEATQIQFRSLRDDVVPRAQRLISPTLSSYSSGQGSLLAVIEAAQALRSVQAETVMAETSLGLAWARLNRMTGTSTTKENQ